MLRLTFMPVELESLVLGKCSAKVPSCYKNVELHNMRNYVVTYRSIYRHKLLIIFLHSFY